MDYKEIREYAALMKEMGLTVLDYSGAGSSIRLERAVASAPSIETAVVHAQIQPEVQAEETASASGTMIRSPMVGVFYTSPGADKAPYVSVGDKVHAGDVLCIIEAMKIMNEITAEHDGVITEICAENKQVVEFGQPIFRIDTAQA